MINEDYKKITGIVAPITFQNLMTSMVVATDAVMLGLMNQTSLSAVSLATQVAFFFGLFILAFMLGFNVLGAQYWGKKDEHSVVSVITITMKYQLIVGIFFTSVTLICPQTVMRMFTPDKELIAAGAEYLRYVSVSFMLTSIAQLYFGVLKVCDHPGISSMIGSISVVLNIVLNAVLIFGVGSIPGMGIKGAAIATVIARLFEVVSLLLIVVKKKYPRTGTKLLLQKSDTLLLKDYLKYTGPLVIQLLGWGGGMTMYSVIMGHLGSDAVAANSIASIVRSLVASL